ncbi:ATP-binding protein [Oscillospiraceae bacterium 44-34]
MKRKWKISSTIENKILFPFVCISMVTVLCFCFILYRIEYDVKLRTETLNAQALVEYINADIDAGQYWKEPADLLEKYADNYRGDSLFLYGAGGELLFSRRPLGDLELVLEDSRNNRLNWRVLYSLDQRAIRLEFIEEQRYMILAAVAMLLIIVQASVFIAYNISAPLRQLSKVCTLVSRDPGGSEDLSVEYIRRRDETGQLAAAFQAMLDSQRRYTRELTQVKMLNETIVANLPLGVVVRDGKGVVILKNIRADGMLRQSGERDKQGRSLETLLAELARQDPVLPSAVRLYDQSGKVRDCELGAWTLRGADGDGCGMLYTIDDVTYQRHMEEKLSREEKLAYTGRLAADVAHEARNPLAGIRAGLQVLEPKLLQERDAVLCREMMREVDRVNLLIENLLNLSRQRESEKTTVSLNSLFDELAMLYFKVAENKGIALSVEMERALWLFADEQQLRQILINLINNSIKAMPEGGRVLLTGRTAADGVTVIVADSGPGMSREKLERVLSGQAGGLGLSIVQRLLEQNGGSLDIDSAPDEGTRAVLTFHGTGGDHEI